MTTGDRTPRRSTPPFHPRSAAHRRRGRGRLRVGDAVAMAVGGMIGGGIFSVLGVAVSLAGHLAAVVFVLGGVVALVTAHSFATLSVRTGRSGGLFVYLHEAGYPRLGSYLSWLLMFGYVVALAVYGFTFGHYAAHVLGLSEVAADGFALLALVLFLAVNLRGVGASALSEDVVVLTKVVVLALVAGIGLLHFSPARLQPLSDMGVVGVLVAATAVFVAFEGFELLSFDYDDIEDARHALPLALYLSVGVVTAIYVVVTIGSQMLVSDAAIVAQRDVAFAAAGQAALGTVGTWIATLGALLASSSAINATLFSTARQMHEVAVAGELPAVFSRSARGLPVSALVLLTVFAGLFSLLPDIESLLTLGSGIFLVVFGVTNALALRVAAGRASRFVSAFGAVACAVALVVLLVRLVVADRSTLLLSLGCVGVVSLLRLAYVRWR